MRQISVEIVNMIMIYDKDNRKAVVLHRVKSWPGITFPGGHAEKGESFVASAIREAKEETGLDIRNLESCGTVDWADSSTGRRYLEFLYKTSDYTGSLREATEEGAVEWMSFDDIRNSENKSPNFELYLPMFFDGKYNEMFFEWDGTFWTAEPHYL